MALILASATLGQETLVSARIVGVTDGDTVKALAAGNQLLRIRLSWIDAPESSQAFGQRSKQHLSELVFGREVELHTHGLDRYGRTLAVIYIDGVDANLDQVRSGSAWVYEHYISEAPLDIQASYHAAQLAAQQERRGLWSDTQEPMPPWKYRHASKQTLDYLVPLELGGNSSIENLWPELWAEAIAKDALENRLHALVCAGELSLLDARTQISSDWEACYRRYLGNL